jgi:hypothetical protein
MDSGTSADGCYGLVEAKIGGARMRRGRAPRFALMAWFCILATPPALADVRILGSPGGLVGPFVETF